MDCRFSKWVKLITTGVAGAVLYYLKVGEPARHYESWSVNAYMTPTGMVMDGLLKENHTER